MSTLDFSYLDKIISGQIRYYTHLSSNGKERFCSRVNTFMQGKVFEGMEDFEITDEVKILISAAAVQLTFGLDDYSLDEHNLIRVFPETFYNTRTGDEYKGLTLQRSLIVLSWDDFEHGYLIHNDNYNLGLHELAHVLRLSVNTDDFDERFANYLDNWDTVAGKELEHIRKYPDESFLRSYASTNMSEFFSVCVEYFFEVPQKFSHHLPEIFNHLCVLLNQNTLNVQNDYKPEFSNSNIQLIENINVQPIEITNENDKPFFLFREWTQHADTFVAISFFVGLLCIWPLIFRMKINFGTFCTAGMYSFFAMLAVTQIYRVSFTSRRIDSIDIMRMVLLAPFFSLIIFTVNFVTPGEKVNETYSIRNAKVRALNSTTDEAIVEFNDDEMFDFARLRTFKTETNTYNWDKVAYQFETGIFGYKNLKSRTIILKDNTQILY